MAAGTVVLTPGAPSIDPAPGVAVLDLSESHVPGDSWTAQVALAIHAQGPTPPLVLVFGGPACVHAPHLGFAQRSARRSVSAYVLVDPVLPAPGAAPDWPDAPVIVVVTPDADSDTRSAALGARLRGWEVLDGTPNAMIDEVANRP